MKKLHKFFIALCTFIPLLLVCSCGGETSYSFSEIKKEKADSILKSVKGIENLEAVRTQFRNDRNKEGEMLALKKLGKEYRRANRFTDAIEAHTEGENIAKSICDTVEIVQALNNIGTNYRRLGVLDEAAQFHFRALKLCMAFSDKETFQAKKNRVISLNGIGNISLTLNDIVTADSVFRQALEGERELNSSIGQAINYANIGSLFETKNQTDSAWYYYRKSMEMNIEGKSDLGISLCHTYFGNLYEKEGRMDKAVDEYKKAYSIMEEKVDKWHWLASCIALVRIYIKQKDFPTALRYLKKAEDVAAEANSLEHLAMVHKCYFDIYNSQKLYKKALDAYLLSEKYNEMIAGTENMTKIQNERVHFEYDRRQREIDDIHSNYMQERKYKNIISITTAVIIILAAIAIVLLYYSLRLRKKKQISMNQLEQIRSSFFTNITHEFRTPLTVVIGLGERLKAGNLTDDEEIRNTGKMIVRQGNGLLELINQLLEISRVKSAIGTSEYRNGDIVGYIHTIIEGSRELTKQKQIELVYKPATPKIIMDFIPDYIHKILRNLLSNAVKYTPEFGRIYVTTEITGDKLKLQIADSGSGIPFKDIPHIFETFYQGGNSKGRVGTGVGLALIRQLTEAMDGQISVRSAEGEGSVFILELPLKHGKQEWEKIDNREITGMERIPEVVIEKPVELPADSDCHDENCPSILIIEDNADISSYIGSVLKGKHSLFFAENGKTGLQKALGVMPDVIITDLMMPEMDGLELCRQIRKSEILNHIPVIVITAKCTEQDKIEGLKAGADTYLYKPFNAEELNVSVNSLLQRRKRLQEKYSSGMPVENQESVSNVDREFITRIVDVVYARMPDGNADINGIAAAMSMSARQLNRKILAVTGCNASKYIMQIRLTKAKKLLENEKNYTISEIAIKCGFEENSNFTRAFKNAYNITPSQYRKMPAEKS